MKNTDMTKEQLLDELKKMEHRIAELETELRKNREAGSLNVFASGIAHEYNNLLTAIIGNLSLAKMYAKPGYEVYDVLAEAEKASLRAKDLTLQLLTFNREKIEPSEETLKQYPAGKGKVLIMDDEEIVSLVVGKLLNQCGYQAEFARNGREMLRIYKAAMAAGAPFDAVIMDLVIDEGMGGQEAIKCLLETDPNAKAIVSSGYSNAPVMSHFREFGFAGFLAKPYRLGELSRVLHETLAETVK